MQPAVKLLYSKAMPFKALVDKKDAYYGNYKLFNQLGAESVCNCKLMVSNITM